MIALKLGLIGFIIGISTWHQIKPFWVRCILAVLTYLAIVCIVLFIK